jgi:hypothetical protein
LRKCLLPLFLLYCSAALAQKKNAAFRLEMQKASSAITIDGVLDEAAWKDAAVAGNFFMVLPMDTSAARVRTDVRMTYDDRHLFLSAECYHALPGPYFVESLRRDFAFGKNDNFLVFMDPFDDQTNGFAFGTNAAGAQWDGSMYEGSKVDLNWDNKWISEVKHDSDKWVLELAIPFKSIRYKKGIQEWGINFSRLDLKTTEKSSWAPVPRQFPTAALAYSGVLVWDAPPPVAGANISLIPYVLGGISKDYEQQKKEVWRRDAGMDAKIALSSALNLDLTINPDFSQVEVDRQVTNLDRFELFFPERRQFFLENGDLFANFGYGTIRPFFSRRIGLGVPIHFGARISGKPNRNWRIGAMDVQTGKVDALGLPVQNFTVASVQRRVFSRSNIGAIFINRQSLQYRPDSNSGKPLYNQYNRNLGLEYNLASSNNLWTGKSIFLKSFTPGTTGRDMVYASHLQYLSRRWLLFWQHEYVGKNYNAEVGYVPRKGYVRINPIAGYSFFPKGGRVLSHGPRYNYFSYFSERLKRTDDEHFLGYTITYRSQNILFGWVAHDYVRLLQPFDPTNYTKDTLARGTEHRWWAYGLEFYSKPQSVFTYTLTSRYGGYYAGGKRLSLTADIGYRFQPYVSIALSTNYNNIHLPQPWGNNSFWLIGPRVDVTFTNKLFFTTFLQYNEQLQNINLNTRLQWRYKPASDLFLVYTDNYLQAPFGVRNRAFVLKWNYWWNL